MNSDPAHYPGAPVTERSLIRPIEHRSSPLPAESVAESLAAHHPLCFVLSGSMSQPGDFRCHLTHCDLSQTTTSPPLSGSHETRPIRRRVIRGVSQGALSQASVEQARPFSVNWSVKGQIRGAGKRRWHTGTPPCRRSRVKLEVEDGRDSHLTFIAFAYMLDT